MSASQLLNLATPASASSLAASFGLSAAWSSKNPSRPLAGDRAVQWLGQYWSVTSGKVSNRQNVEFVQAGINKTVLQVNYPARQKGGVQFWLDGWHSKAQTIQTALVTYKVAFEADWTPVKGGKLPGLYGGSQQNECTGGDRKDTCFSARMMWRGGGLGEVYAYMPIYEQLCGQSDVECGNDVYGISLSRGAWTFPAGAWTTVTQLVALNEPPSANGLLLVYVNDTLVLAQTGLVWRTANVSITNVLFSTFYGGSSADYLPTRAQQAYFTDFQIFASESPSLTAGPEVDAGLHTSQFSGARGERTRLRVHLVLFALLVALLW